MKKLLGINFHSTFTLKNRNLKTVLIICAQLFFLISLAFAQIEFDFSGYVVNLPTYQKTNSTISALLGIDQSTYLDLTRLRLRPTVYPTSSTTIVLEYEINPLYQSSSFLFAAPSGRTNRQNFDLRWTPITEDHFTLTHFIDRLYVRQAFKKADVTVGRQRISWGTGRIWNPTDLFNPINPANFDKIEKDGADAVSTRLYLGNFTDLEVVYNTVDKFNESNYGARFRTNYKAYDFSIMSGYFDQRVVAGADFAGNLLEAGFRGEGIISAEKDDLDSNFIKYILGLDYQFTPELYGLIEYHFNGEGAAKKSGYELTRLIRGEILNLSRNYVFLQSTYQIHPLLNNSLSLNMNLDDGSGFTSGSLTYSLAENWYLSLGALVPFGSSFDEYWYYPTSLYLKGEFYF